MKKVNAVGVAGAGTMGSAIAQKFAQVGLDVILLDTQSAYLQKSLERIKGSLNEAVEKRIISDNQAAEIIARINPADDISKLSKCDLIIEAIFEDFETKTAFFRTLSSIVNPDTIIATNTSSFSVSELAECVSNPERFLGMHYFYHAAKNRLVEIIPGKKTSSEILKCMMRFSSQTGKDYIICKDSYGFVVNRFFVPWLNEAVRLYEEKIAATEVIDSVCKRVFSIGMGPFELMNATGVSIAYHSEKTLERFGALYKTSELLKKQSESGKGWTLEENNKEPASEESKKVISDRMLGTVFLICSQLLDEQVCNADEINRGARIGLKWRKGPVELMMHCGKEDVLRLIKQTAGLYNTSVPISIGEEHWKMNFVSLNKYDDRALITISRPEDLNALNWNVVCQLSRAFDQAENDSAIRKIFITGTGKAFVAGADIKFFLDNIKANTINDIIEFTKYCQYVFKKIDNSQKLVVAVLNGLTLGGGLELALCADVILALPDALMSFPETGIGIYPGLGGTQRTQYRIGKGLTKYLIYTGAMLTAADAERIGFADKVIQRDDFYCMIENSEDFFHSVRKRPISLDDKYAFIQHFFNTYSLRDISDGKLSLSSETASDLVKKIQRKAPLALSVSEKLINEAKGCESELEDLKNIFSTSDAFLGLSSIGKKVEFQGK